MNIRHLALPTLVVTALSCGYGGVLASERSLAAGPNALEPHAVVATYLKAVDRGELVVFERRLDRSMISPKRVEYTFELDSPVSTVKIYAELRQPMAVPHQDDCEVRGVRAALDDAGKIVETEVHVWQKKQIKTRC